jgi:small redox-active disulfide protein 2
MKRIQVLGPGCHRCTQLCENAAEAVAELGWHVPIEAVTDIRAIIAMDALMTPALAIDGEVRAAGDVLSAAQIKQMLMDHFQPTE